MRLAHLTDVHLGPFDHPPFRELASKRVLGYANWHRKRRRIHRRAILDRIIADMRAHAPDHIAVTGDLVNIAASTEWQAARHFLEQLGPPDRVSLVPGNHDVYVSAAIDAVRAFWGAYLTGDAPPDDGLDPGGLIAGDPHHGFPWLRLRGKAALIGCSSAVATRAFLATGRLGAGQLTRLAALLDDTGRRGLCRVVLIHHPPLLSLGRPRRGLDDAAALTQILVTHGAELVLFGHNHVSTLDMRAHETGHMAIVGTASASATAHGAAPAAQYALLDITGQQGGWHIALTRRGLVGDDVVTLETRPLLPATG